MRLQPIGWLTVATIAMIGWSGLRQARRQRLARKPPPAKPAPIQAWEGEGGGLPDGGPGPGVKLASPPESA